MSADHQPIQLLQACVDEEDDSYLRLLWEGKFVKYITIAAGVYNVDDLCFEPALVPLLPSFPPGDWNEGHIALDPATEKPHFSKVEHIRLPGVKSVWHPTRMDHLDLTLGKKLRTGIYETTSPRFKYTVVVKFARFPWEIDALERETKAYEWIEGRNIGPQFLGHVTEEGRVIGFIMEKIIDMRHAAPTDIKLCRDSLSRLHSLGVIHGDTNKHNFLIAGGRAILIDFDSARKSDDLDSFEKEKEDLSIKLADSSGKGGSRLVT